MSGQEFKLPESIATCTPCQEKVVAGALLSICNTSKELQAEVDCKKLAAQINSGTITKKKAIQLIASKAQGKNIEHLVNKVLKTIE